MDALWGLVSLVPILIYGLIVYGLLVVLPRRFRARKNAKLDAQPRRPDAGPTSQRPAQQASPASDAADRALLAAMQMAAANGVSEARTDRSPPSPGPAPETISIVLRRQVPPDPGHSARSWLGGLPRMPADIEWPRSVSSEHPKQGERPLHFLAQICCADLPRDLWGGLGPRQGWLLVFIDPNQGVPEASDAFRIIHTPELGSERAPPPDLGPVHDGMYTGGSYRWLPQGQVPPVWRRWPVDIVPFPNTLHDQNGRSVVTPKGFAETLYKGAPVIPYRDLKPVRPYRVGHALKSVRALAAQLRNPLPPVAGQDALALLGTEGSLDQFRGSLATQIAKFAERKDGSQSTGLLERRRRILDLVTACATPDMLLEQLEKAHEQHRQWRVAMADECDALAAELETEAPDSPLSLAAWQELQARFAGQEHPVLDLYVDRYAGASQQLGLVERDDQAHLESPKGVTEEAMLDWLDPATRPLVPAERVGDLEAAARSLESNRPHRMGGYHDGVQSGHAERPPASLLLLQIASDDGMDWCWGDVGAYYFWISPKQLTDGEFSGVEMWLECNRA